MELSPLSPLEGDGEDKLDAESSDNSFPGCDRCIRMILNKVSSQQRGGNYRETKSWNASHLFHDQCETCPSSHPSDNLLCGSCQHLRLGHLSFCAPIGDLPANVPVFRPEVDTSCPLCQVFNYVAEGKTSPKGTALGYPLYLAATDWRAEEVQWRVTGEPWGFNGTGAFLVVRRGEEGAVVTPALEHRAFETLKSCLQNCDDEHSVCHAPSDIVLPQNFRLIDIKNSRIIPRSQVDPSIGYVALSYVWGSTRDMDSGSAIKSNITQLMSSMDISSLPTTIRDAIQVCQKLGERYIWVDRLCIVQDDKDDKSVQIQAMADIYSAAKLVIVAASGDNMDVGLSGISQPRSPQMSQTLGDAQVIVQLPPMWDVVDNSIWNSRAWTYQEVILAKRKLFFTESQVYFECTCRISHEETLGYSSFDPATHDKQNYPTTTTSLTYNEVGFSKEKMYSTTLSSKWEKPWSAYTRHIPRYRRRQLSHESDLINGVTGILNALYPKDDVYHGIPLPELDIALLWTPETDWHKKKSPSNKKVCSLFPSWSWASSPGEGPQLYNIDFEFRGSLCLWFRPVPIPGFNYDLQVISANSNAPSSWGESTGYMNDDIVRSHMAKALLCGLVEPWKNDKPGKWEKPYAELETLLRGQWPKYTEFWNDVFGRDETIARAREKLQGLTDKLQDGLLVTRAQVARLKIKGKGTSARILNDADQEVGWYINDNNNQIAELQRQGQEIFEFVALSVSASGVDPTPENTFEDLEGNLPKVLPIINAMIVRKEGDYYYRMGLTKIFMKCWVELNVPFQTVLLA